MNHAFTKLANAVATAAGKPATFSLCCLLVVVWAALGPLCGFSDTWQLVINTGTTIVTFLMVFLIQNTQNRDGEAIHTKLDEILELLDPETHIVGIEHLTDKEIEDIRAKIETRVNGEAGKPDA